MKLGYIYKSLELQNFLKDIAVATEAQELEERIAGSRAEEEGRVEQPLSSVQLR